jgi:predicted nuclease of predicted toxin-antitoxin system
MKFLLDQNLSWRLVGELQDLFPGGAHVRELGLDRATDDEIWEYARQEGFAIVSKDADFEQRSVLRGHPPKCIWLRVGNCTTQDIEDAIRDHAARIQEFADAETESFMVLP